MAKTAAMPGPVQNMGYPDPRMPTCSEPAGPYNRGCVMWAKCDLPNKGYNPVHVALRDRKTTQDTERIEIVHCLEYVRTYQSQTQRFTRVEYPKTIKARDHRFERRTANNRGKIRHRLINQETPPEQIVGDVGQKRAPGPPGSFQMGGTIQRPDAKLREGEQWIGSEGGSPIATGGDDLGPRTVEVNPSRSAKAG